MPGDFVIFMGCLLHYGAPYEEDNVRIHAYILSEKYNKYRTDGKKGLAIFLDPEDTPQQGKAAQSVPMGHFPSRKRPWTRK